MEGKPRFVKVKLNGSICFNGTQSDIWCEDENLSIYYAGDGLVSLETRDGKRLVLWPGAVIWAQRPDKRAVKSGDKVPGAMPPWTHDAIREAAAAGAFGESGPWKGPEPKETPAGPPTQEQVEKATKGLPKRKTKKKKAKGK